jgi:hypothetical protein
MYPVERLRTLGAPPTHLWPPSLRVLESLGRPKVFSPVFEIVGLVLLFVAH